MFKFKKKPNQPEGQALLSEKEVLQRLEIKSFKKMTEDKIPEFTAMIPNMQDGVTQTALQQFPHFTKMAGLVVANYKDILTESLKGNNDSNQAVMDSCQKIIDTLNELLKQKKLWWYQKKFITEKLMELVKIQKNQDGNNKDWLTKIVAIASATAVALIAITAKIISSKSKK